MNKLAKVLEIIFLVFIIIPIVLLMTLFKGNNVNHNEAMYVSLLALFAYIISIFLLSLRRKKYFFFVLTLNAVGIIYVFTQILQPQNRNSFSGIGQSTIVIFVLLSLFILDSVIVGFNMNHKIRNLH